jgi:hypothetical protein
MSTNTSAQSVAPPIAVSLEALKAFEKERACYRRELPRLLAEGQGGRYALIKGDAILSISNTWGDANQVGLDRFGLDEVFCVQKIDAQDQERFALLDAWLAAQCPR